MRQFKTVLITGANRGIGKQWLRHFEGLGAEVIATARQPQLVETSIHSTKIFPLDLADQESIDMLAHNLKGQPIDLLINNAGIYGATGRSLDDLDTNEWLHVFRVNCIAPTRLTSQLLDNIRLGQGKTIAFTSSKMASMADNHSGGAYSYRSAKAALNACVKSLANDLASEDISVLALHPGWVKTDMTGPNALIDTATSVAGMWQVIQSEFQTGEFIDYKGERIPW